MEGREAPASEGRAELVFGAPARHDRTNFERVAPCAPADRLVSPTMDDVDKVDCMDEWDQ